MWGFVLRTVELRQDNAVINFVAKGTDLRGQGEGSQAGKRLLTPGDGAEGGLGEDRGHGGRKQQDSQSLLKGDWTSLAIQWLGLSLPLQGTRVWSLILEDPTFHGAIKPGAATTEPTCPRAHALQQKPPQ